MANQENKHQPFVEKTRLWSIVRQTASAAFLSDKRGATCVQFVTWFPIWRPARKGSKRLWLHRESGCIYIYAPFLSSSCLSVLLFWLMQKELAWNRCPGGIVRDPVVSGKVDWPVGKHDWTQIVWSMNSVIEVPCSWVMPLSCLAILKKNDRILSEMCLPSLLEIAMMNKKKDCWKLHGNLQDSLKHEKIQKPLAFCVNHLACKVCAQI